MPSALLPFPAHTCAAAQGTEVCSSGASLPLGPGGDAGALGDIQSGCIHAWHLPGQPPHEGLAGADCEGAVSALEEEQQCPGLPANGTAQAGEAGTQGGEAGSGAAEEGDTQACSAGTQGGGMQDNVQRGGGGSSKKSKKARKRAGKR